ncbi:MAG: 16S rRNA (cytosine(1402)-N(4))-methyltransferase RsmH [Pseudomonadota bacterium]
MFWPSLASDPQPPFVTPPSAGPGHIPVLVTEIVSLLVCGSGKNFLDLTVGGGGHSEAILAASAPDGRLTGSDRDAEALARAGNRLRPFGTRVRLFYGSLSNVRETIENSGLSRIDGALIDCGVSSHQLEDPRRGFSFRSPGPLDMRMDPASGTTAAQWLARVPVEKLANVIFEFGQERFARRIAKAIVAARREKKIETTEDLSAIVRGALPAAARGGPIDPATRTFQAIRILINDELGELTTGVTGLLDLLPSRARVAVISFHSLEDRIVKNLFRDAARDRRGTVVTPKPLRPTRAETLQNPRSRSARLRVFEIGGGGA